MMSIKQGLAWDTINRPDVKEMLYGGAKGGAKSVFLCLWMFLSAWEIARRYVPEPLTNPIPVGWLGRKVAKHFEDTTLETWKRFIPEGYYRTVDRPPDIIIGDRVKIVTGGLDSSQTMQKFNSAEFALIGVDQAEETSMDDVGVLRATRRLVINGHHIPAKIVYTANPANCWLKDYFINSTGPGRVFLPALYKDNPWLPPDYMRTLEESFAHRPDLLRAYRDGDWTDLSAVDQVILESWITAARTRIGHQCMIRRLVTVDPAYFGDDRCVILALENTRIIGVDVLPQSSSKDIAFHCYAMALEVGSGTPVPIVVEQVGADDVSGRLRELGANVIVYNPAEASSNQDKYFNKRAEVWSTVAKWMQQGYWDASRGLMFQLPESDDRYESDATESALWQAWQSVRKELTWPKYKFRGQRVLIQAKEDIKAEHEGKSPDFADAYVNGVYHLPYVETVQIKERERPRRYEDRSERMRKKSL
jgi:hypothetical protein